MMLQQYLRFNDTELANALRTLTYLRRGLGGPMFHVGLASVVSSDCVSGHGYRDDYVDVYEGDPFPTCELACYCRTIDTGPYQDPAYDMAPWYDPAVPESIEFLGFVPEIRLAAVGKRQVGKRAWGGANIGPITYGPRVVQVRGSMFASSPSGMAYGERWVTQVLSGSATGCAGDVLTVLPACPDEDETDGAGALRELADIGLVDGPTFTPIGNFAECRVEDVAFQLVAGQPGLRRRTPLADIDLHEDPDETDISLAAGLVAPTAAIITVTPGPTDLSGLVFTAKPGNCPIIGAPTMEFEMLEIPAFSRLVIDSSRRVVQLRNFAGTVIGSFDYLLFDGLFPWLVAPAGSSLCVHIDASAAMGTMYASVTVEQVDLEF